MNDTISVAEAAEIMKVSEGYIRRLLRESRIESRKTGGLWLVSRASVEQYAAAHPREKPGAGPATRGGKGEK